MAVFTYYFNASGGATTDPDSEWNNEANLTDGSTSTNAYNNAGLSSVGSTSSHYMYAKGTDAPSIADPITQVRARLYGADPLNQNSVTATIYTASLGENLGTCTSNSTFTAEWGNYVTLSAPSGGWTSTTVRDLETKVYDTQVPSGSFGVTVYRVELEVTVTSETLSTDQILFNFTEPTIPLITQDASQNFTIDTTTITQNHNIGTDDIAFSTGVDDGSIGQNHVIATQDISHVSTLDSSAITQNHVIVTQDISHNLTVDNTGLNIQSQLYADDVGSVFTIEGTVITQNHVLPTDDISFNTQVDDGGLSQNHIIDTQDISLASSVDTTTITQNHIIPTNDIQFTTSVDSTNLDINVSLAPDDISFTTTVDNVTIDSTANFDLVTQDISHSLNMTGSSPVLDEAGEPILDESGEPITDEATDVGLIINYSLDTDDINFITQVDDAGLIQDHVLTPEDIAFQQAIDGTSITQNHVLAPQDLYHLFTTDNTDLIQNYNLAIDDIEHTITLTNTVVENTNHYLADADISFGPSKRDFYFDSDGNIYWVIDHNVGLVEKV